jgi:hypothetical protein
MDSVIILFFCYVESVGDPYGDVADPVALRCDFVRS